MQKKSFILYCDYLEHVDLLSNEEAGKLLKAVLQYAASGDTRESLDSAAMMAFSFIKSQMERDNTEYAAKCERLRANGAKGGRPKQMVIEEPKGNQEKQMVIEEPKAPLNDNDIVNKDDINKTLMVVCDLLNQAREAAGGNKGKGVLKAKSNTAVTTIEYLLKDGFEHDFIVSVAKESLENGDCIDWYDLEKRVRENKKGVASRKPPQRQKKHEKL